MQSASQSIFRKRVLPCVILLGLCGFSAQATIPLVLKETIQLPPGGVQDVQHVLTVADRVACFLAGRISLEGTPSEMTPEAITAAYFGM